MVSGIYSITSKSGNCYIGSAKDVIKRKNSHFSALRNDRHHSKSLQRSFNKYGEHGLIFKVLFFCDAKNLLFYEQQAINILKPKYNICKIAGSPMAGRSHSNETKEKMRLLRSNPEYRRKLSLKKKGVGHPSTQETNEKIRAAQARSVKCVENGIIFSSLFEAVKWLNLSGKALAKNSSSNISGVLRGIYKTAYGFHWELVNNNKD